jgi:hypothetical protein
MMDPEGMEAEFGAGQVELVQLNTTDMADSATRLQRVDDHRLAATLEVTERAEACDSGIEQLHLPCQVWSFA